MQWSFFRNDSHFRWQLVLRGDTNSDFGWQVSLILIGEITRPSFIIIMLLRCIKKTKIWYPTLCPFWYYWHCGLCIPSPSWLPRLIFQWFAGRPLWLLRIFLCINIGVGIICWNIVWRLDYIILYFIDWFICRHFLVVNF
jgi:hypothetical protein